MSHGHSHHVEENPKTSSSAAFYFVILLVAFVVGLFGFVQSMSHHDEGHGNNHPTDAPAGHQEEHHTGKGHTWTHEPTLEYSTVSLTGGQAPHVTLKQDNPVSIETSKAADTIKHTVDSTVAPKEGHTTH